MHSELVHHSQDTMARQGATFSREEDEELGDQLDMDLPDEEDDFVFELKKPAMNTRGTQEHNNTITRQYVC